MKRISVLLLLVVLAAGSVWGETKKVVLETKVVSISSSLVLGDNFSRLGNPPYFRGGSTLSDDGRYVVFQSDATNLVTNDTNETSDIFLNDTVTKTTTRVSNGINNQENNGYSSIPSISVNGRYFVFQSDATNLVANDTNETSDVFLYDTVTEVTTRVSNGLDGEESNAYSSTTSISDNGRYLVFDSRSTNIVANDTNETSDVFLYDTVTETTMRVSNGLDGGESNAYSSTPSISDDGKYVVFTSNATNLVANDTNETSDVFLHDTHISTTRRILAAINNSNSHYWPIISGNGRYIIFVSSATNLVANDTNEKADIFLHDTENNTTTRVSVSSNGVESNGFSDMPSIDDDGGYIVFSSNATNLVEIKNDNKMDVFHTKLSTIYILPTDINSINLADALNDILDPEEEIDDLAIDSALIGALTFSDFVSALFDLDVNTPNNLQLSQVRVAISQAQSLTDPYHLPFALEPQLVKDELNSIIEGATYIEDDVISALEGAGTFDDFANALFDTASQSEKDQLTLAINQARSNEIDLGLAASRLNLDQTLLTLALDVHTDSNGNTDFHQVAVDLEGIDRLELKRAIATSQAKSTFTISLVKGLNMISLPNVPETDLKASGLANKITQVDVPNVGVNFLISLNQNQKFVAFVPSIDSPSGIYDFGIEGGKGYIINMSDSNPVAPRQVNFDGRIWSKHASAPTKVNENIWAFVLDCQNIPSVDNRQPSFYKLTNQKTKAVASTGLIDKTNGFRIILVDKSQNSVVNSGDEFDLEVLDKEGKLYAYTEVGIGITEIQKGIVKANLAPNQIPEITQILQNYPNPFNPETWIPFQLAQDSTVTATIYDVTGKKIRMIELGHIAAGNYVEVNRAIYWDGRSEDGEQVSSGTYFYQIEAGDYTETRKMVILK